MTSRVNRPPVGQPWVWLTRELLCSDAWRSLSINARRLIDFLVIEHMSKGGKSNGKLKAPYAHLEVFGIAPRHVAPSIREAEDLGLVDCSRGGRRVATTYGLAWLPLHDGTQASNRWRTYRNPALPPMPVRKSRNLPTEGKVELPTEGKVDGRNLPTEGKVDDPQNLPTEGKVLLRNSNQGADEYSDLSAAAPPAANGRAH